MNSFGKYLQLATMACMLLPVVEQSHMLLFAFKNTFAYARIFSWIKFVFRGFFRMKLRWVFLLAANFANSLFMASYSVIDVSQKSSCCYFD